VGLRTCSATQSEPNEAATASSSQPADAAHVFGGSGGLTADAKQSMRFWNEHHADAGIPQGLLEGLLEESERERRAARRWLGNCVDGLHLGEWTHAHAHHTYHALIHPCGGSPTSALLYLCLREATPRRRSGITTSVSCRLPVSLKGSCRVVVSW